MEWGCCPLNELYIMKSMHNGADQRYANSLGQNILRSAFLDCKLIECINKLKERMCQSERDESAYGSTQVTLQALATST